MKTTVIASFSAPGWHAWPGAPLEVSYLKMPHRHLFYFRIEVNVTDPDREVEFHLLSEHAKKRAVKLFGDGLGCDFQSEIHEPNGFRFGARSCEHIAKELGEEMRSADNIPVTAIEVWEDRENGSRVEWSD